MKKWKAIRQATPRDRRRLRIWLRLGDGPHCRLCSAEHLDWQCSLNRRHQGNHEAWATEPLELCAEWPREDDVFPMFLPDGTVNLEGLNALLRAKG